MFLRLTLLTGLMASNYSLVSGSGQCFCPVKVDSNDDFVPGRCKNSKGVGKNPSKPYKKITTIGGSGSFCNQECEDEGDACQGWGFFSDPSLNASRGEDVCHLFDYKPDTVKTNRDSDKFWQCRAKGTLADTFSLVGPGICQGSRLGGQEYTQLRAYSGPSDSQNENGRIESLEECKKMCLDSVEIEEYFFYEPAISTTPRKPESKCEGFNFITEKCTTSSGGLRNRCSTNCFLYATAPTAARARASRKQSYDNYSCYAMDCTCP